MNTFYKISVIGLGYVGLPLAVAFAKKGFQVVGFDINKQRISELQKGFDNTLEIENSVLSALDTLQFSNDIALIKSSTIYIITVPTPIDAFKTPNLNPLIAASKTVGSVLKKGDIVIYESTVFPGCTEDICVPQLEKQSGLGFNTDFYCGYAPERINPGDPIKKVHNITRVTSGSTIETAATIDALYNTIVTVGTYKAPSIKVAEASKVIENIQRDINISLMNELALIFDKLNIDTLEVLKAAGTKWNFLPFKPGLVGGHCISVDPYYLTHKAESVGYYPEVILSGRRINDQMGVYIANKVVKLMVANDQVIKGAKALVLGITFKENCPDIRNSKVIDIINELKSFGIYVDVYDPHANAFDVKTKCQVNLLPKLTETYNAIVVAVAHNEFITLNYAALKTNKAAVIYDVKGMLPKHSVTARL